MESRPFLVTEENIRDPQLAQPALIQFDLMAVFAREWIELKTGVSPVLPEVNIERIVLHGKENTREM